MNPLISFVGVGLLLAGQHPQMPAGMSHEEHLKQMQKDEALKKRGADAMGFDQDATAHHFGLAVTGGSIEVTVRDQADQNTIAAIRSHLRSIASEFANGQFEKPFQTHDEVVPGVVEMQRAARTLRTVMRTCLRAAPCASRRKTDPRSKRCTSSFGIRSRRIAPVMRWR